MLYRGSRVLLGWSVENRHERHDLLYHVQMDDHLRQLVAKHGPKRWSVIAKELKVKSSKQCRRRWKNVLNATRKTGVIPSAPHRCLSQTDLNMSSKQIVSGILLCVPSGDWTKDEDQVCCAADEACGQPCLHIMPAGKGASDSMTSYGAADSDHWPQGSRQPLGAPRAASGWQVHASYHTCCGLE